MATPQARYMTNQFLLRPWQEADAALMADAVSTSHDHLQPWLDWTRPDQTTEGAREIIVGFEEAWDDMSDFVIGVFSPDEGNVLGGTGFHLRGRPPDDRAEIGMWIHTDHASSGLGTAVLTAMLDWGFRDWGWRRVTWLCDTRNLASARVAEKCGMRLEGQHRQDVRASDGTLRDTLLFAKLAEEHPA